MFQFQKAHTVRNYHTFVGRCVPHTKILRRFERDTVPLSISAGRYDTVYMIRRAAYNDSEHVAMRLLETGDGMILYRIGDVFSLIFRNFYALFGHPSTKVSFLPDAPLISVAFLRVCG